MAQSDRIANMQASAARFRIKHPRLVAAHEQFDIARKRFVATRGMPQRIRPLIGPSRSGKTTLVDAYIETVAKREGLGPADPHPVLRIQLSADASIKSLASDILLGLGSRGLPPEIVDDMSRRHHRVRKRQDDPWRDVVVPQMMYAAAQALRSAAVELLFVDDVHNLIHKDSQKLAFSVTDHLRVLADRGVCGVSIVGTNDARRLLSVTTNDQFALRCDHAISLAPLDISLTDEAAMFVGYIEKLGRLIDKAAGFEPGGSLTWEGTHAGLFQVSKGVIGIVSEVVTLAAEYAIRRDAKHIERQDLSLATVRWAIPAGLTAHDPFGEAGPMDVKLVQAAPSRGGRKARR